MRLGDIAERNARHAGNLEAVIFKSRRLTWKDFNERANSIANGLLKLNVKKGDRVTLFLANSHAIINCYYGIPKIGAITVPLNTMLSKRELEYIINDCKPEVLIYSSTYESIVKTLKELDGCKSLKTFICFDQDCTGFKSEMAMDYEDLATKNSKDPPKLDVKIDDRAPAFLSYTGGTTGNPKGVLLNQFSLIQSALLTIATGAGDSTIARGDRVLLPLPIFHLAATLGVITDSLVIATTIALDSFNTSEMLRIAETENATTMCFIPTMLNLFVQQDDLIKSHNLASLKYIIYGAAPMHVAILKKAMSLFPGIKFEGGYGLSEFSPVIAWLTPADHNFALQPENEYMLLSAGRPMMGVTLKIVDQNDVELPRGKVGEIVVQGDGMMIGYWNLPQKTEEAMRGGWLHTGDMAYLDDDDYLFIVDRSKDMIKSGSENVFSKEVEDALYKHEAVLECAVIAKPDPKWGRSRSCSGSSQAWV